MGRWPAVRWGLSILFPVALLLWGLLLAFAPDQPGLLRITVQSQESGDVVEGASVVVGDVRYLTDASGSIVIDPVPAGTNVVVSAPGHEPARAETATDKGEEKTVWLGAVLVIGSVTDRISGEPVAGATLVVLDASGEEMATTRTEEGGGFVFALMIEDAQFVITHDIYGTQRQELGSSRIVHVVLDPPPISGRVVDRAGEPVAAAMISGGLTDGITEADGTFTLEDVGQGTELSITSNSIGTAEVIADGTDLGVIEIGAEDATPEGSPQALEGGE